MLISLALFPCARSYPNPYQMPTSCRMLHVDRRILQNAVRNVLDGELLNRYLYLSTMERGELAKKIGTTPDIVSDLPIHPPQPLPNLLRSSPDLPPPSFHRS